MSKYIEIIPCDTLFFRGNIPMEAGLNSAVSLFPPPTSVVKGALWTAYCNAKQRDYKSGLNGGQIPLDVSAIFIKKHNDINGKDSFYIPAPATWYYDSKDKKKNGSDLKDKDIHLIEMKNLKDDFEKLGMCSSADNTEFAVAEKEAQPLNSAWVNVDFIAKDDLPNTFDEDTVLFSGDIYSQEDRIGIGLNEDKYTAEGQIYSATHIRLNSDISLIVSVNNEPDDFTLSDKSFIRFGGEQRVCKVIMLSEDKIGNIKKLMQTNKGERFVSLVPIQASASILANLIAGQKLAITSGWDLARGFHKDSICWIPAGAVFNNNSNIEKFCVPLITKGNN